MTASERAALEALITAMQAIRNTDRRGYEHFLGQTDKEWEEADAAMAAARSLLSSPPPAEPRPPCDMHPDTHPEPHEMFNLGAWPIPDVLERLADAADHLRSGHGCDAHGHEGVLYAAQAARLHVKALRSAPPAPDEGRR